jgi:hypothetical protein
VVVAAWNEYQEAVAAFFRELGLQAETNTQVDGTRTKHDVDVVVRSNHAGFQVLWLVECKWWASRVPKEKVLALRSIVHDVGADRGFIMAEEGYQKGALEAAHLTNVQLTSIKDLRETHGYELGMSQVSLLQQRVDDCSRRYWALPKTHRIDFGLREDVGEFGYSGARVIQAANASLSAAFRDPFPIIYNEIQATLSAFSGARDLVACGTSFSAETPIALHLHLDAQLSKLEQRLAVAEVGLSGSQ